MVSCSMRVGSGVGRGGRGKAKEFTLSLSLHIHKLHVKLDFELCLSYTVSGTIIIHILALRNHTNYYRVACNTNSLQRLLLLGLGLV